MIFENFYVKAKVEVLQLPLPLTAFQKTDDTGVAIEGEYYTIPEYLATFNHTVERFSSDGYFIKGFGFNISGLDEMRERFKDFGMTFNVDVFILSPIEVKEELKKAEWTKDEEI